MIEVRGRLSDRVNRARLKLEARRAARPLVVLAVGAALALVGAAYIAVNVSQTALSSTFQVSFAVDDATAVKPGVQIVKVKGIPAGTITDVRLDGTQPVLTAKIQKRFGKVYRNARATLRPTTALQDMYLDIVDRGTPSAGLAKPSEPLPPQQTEVSVHVDDVLDVFRADERARLATLLDQLGRGLEDRGARLRTAFVQVVPFLTAAKRISAQIDARRPMTRRLVHNMALLMTELRRRDAALRRLVRDGSETLTALESASPSLDATLRELPATLQQINTSFATVRGVLDDVNHAVRSLYPVADQLPEALVTLRRLNTSAAPAVRALRRPVERLLPLAHVLAPVARELQTALQTLRPQVDTIDLVTKRVAGCKTGIQGFFQWDASMAKYGDVRGPVPRGNLVVGLQSSGTLSDPSEFAPQACTPGKPIGGRLPTPADEH